MLDSGWILTAEEVGCGRATLATSLDPEYEQPDTDIVRNPVPIENPTSSSRSGLDSLALLVTLKVDEHPRGKVREDTDLESTRFETAGGLFSEPEGMSIELIVCV